MATLNSAGTTAQKGATAQYQTAATTPGAYNSANIHPFDSGTILGTVPPGKAGIKQIDGTIQNSTDPIVAGQLATNQADNFLSSSTGVGLVPTVNAAQVASAGKSMSPQTE
jgi:hypothetical protein